MATRKKAEPEKEAAREDVPQKAAKGSGSAPGAMAVKTDIPHAAATPPKKKVGKLVKKAKARLPRKEKKQAKKKLLNSAG
jgi:hypothetical protein